MFDSMCTSCVWCVCARAECVFEQIFDGTTDGCEEGHSMPGFAPKPIEFSPTLMQGQAADVDASMTPDTSMVQAIPHPLPSPFLALVLPRS